MMLGTTDWVGLGAVISATFAGLVSLVVAIRQTAVKAIAADTNAKVTTPNGTSIGEIIAANDLTGASTPHDEGAKP